MTLDVEYVADGNYLINDTKYGWSLCSVRFDVEAQDELLHQEIVGLLKPFADAANTLLKQKRRGKNG